MNMRTIIAIRQIVINKLMTTSKKSKNKSKNKNKKI